MFSLVESSHFFLNIMDLHQILRGMCALLFLCTFSFSTVQAQNTPELWDEFLRLQENSIPELNTARANVRFNGVVKAENIRGTMRGRITVLVDVLKKHIQERFTVSFSGQNFTTGEEADISADAEIRLFPEDMYMILHDFEMFIGDDDTAPPPFLQQWMVMSLEELGEEGEDIFRTWPENASHFGYEDMKTQLLQDEDLSETDREMLTIFFESLEQGEIFTLTKKEISETRTAYILRLNKLGTINLLKKMAEIADDPLEVQAINDIQDFLKKITLIISVVVNPQDPNTTKARLYFRGANLAPELSLISLKMFVSEYFNEPISIQKPVDAVSMDELLEIPPAEEMQ